MRGGATGGAPRFLSGKRRRSKVPMTAIFSVLALVGLGAFLFQVSGQHPEKAWQAYLVNFILWSAVAQGGLLFSVVLHITKARWGRPLQGLAESFAAFFPISFVLFLLLFLGRAFVFPWLGGDLHGKEAWLTIPFLFSRDAAGLLILYGLGLGLPLPGIEAQAESKRHFREEPRGVAESNEQSSVFSTSWPMPWSSRFWLSTLS